LSFHSNVLMLFFSGFSCSSVTGFPTMQYGHFRSASSGWKPKMAASHENRCLRLPTVIPGVKSAEGQRSSSITLEQTMRMTRYFIAWKIN
jgi:hypothetical protein